DCDGNLVGIEDALYRKQPLALFILLADDDRVIGPAVKVFAKLHFKQRALLLHHHDQFEAVDEIGHMLEVERPRAGDLEEPDAQIGGASFIDAEVVERLAYIEIARADRHDAELWIVTAGKDDAV